MALALESRLVTVPGTLIEPSPSLSETKNEPRMVRIFHHLNTQKLGGRPGEYYYRYESMGATLFHRNSRLVAVTSPKTG